MKGAIQVTGREHIALAQDADTDATAFLRSAWAHLNNSTQLVNYTENYVYDTAGNLTQMQHAGASTYTRYIDIDTDTNRGLQRPSQGSPDFTNSFDANGNQILMGHVDSLAWDYQDRLQKVVLIPREDDQDDAEWYVYDGSGQRMRKVRETVGYGGTTVTIEEKIYLGDAEIKRIYRKVYDENDVPTTTKILDRTSVHVMDDKSRMALVHHWTVDTDELEVDSTLLNTHRLRYQFGNHLGSAALELDDVGSIISYEEYLPYGGTSFVAGTSQTEVSLKEYRYSGKERDSSTGFYYYGARYYAPWVGRWVSTDPLGLKAGINDYAFVRGNPVTRIDVDGRRDLVFFEPSSYESALKSRFNSETGVKLAIVAQKWNIDDPNSESGPGDEVLSRLMRLSKRELQQIQDVSFQLLDPDTPFVDRQGTSHAEPRAEREAGRYVFEWDGRGEVTRHIVLWTLSANIA